MWKMSFRQSNPSLGREAPRRKSLQNQAERLPPCCREFVSAGSFLPVSLPQKAVQLKIVWALHFKTAFHCPKSVSIESIVFFRCLPQDKASSEEASPDTKEHDIENQELQLGPAYQRVVRPAPDGDMEFVEEGRDCYLALIVLAVHPVLYACVVGSVFLCALGVCACNGRFRPYEGFERAPVVGQQADTYCEEEQADRCKHLGQGCRGAAAGTYACYVSVFVHLCTDFGFHGEAQGFFLYHHDAQDDEGQCEQEAEGKHGDAEDGIVFACLDAVCGGSYIEEIAAPVFELEYADGYRCREQADKDEDDSDPYAFRLFSPRRVPLFQKDVDDVEKEEACDDQPDYDEDPRHCCVGFVTCNEVVIRIVGVHHDGDLLARAECRRVGIAVAFLAEVLAVIAVFENGRSKGAVPFALLHLCHHARDLFRAAGGSCFVRANQIQPERDEEQADRHGNQKEHGVLLGVEFLLHTNSIRAGAELGK